VESVSCLLHFAEAASTPTAISEPENKRSYRYGFGKPAGTLHAERSNKAHLNPVAAGERRRDLIIRIPLQLSAQCASAGESSRSDMGELVPGSH
jgi:hypothetical protein